MSALANLASSMNFATAEALVPFARLTAERGVFGGRRALANVRLIQACTRKFRIRRGLVASVLYTRDTGHHSGAWWKNPDHERCKHLSLAVLEEPGFDRLAFQKT